jgi:hypothetical protein
MPLSVAATSTLPNALSAVVNLIFIFTSLCS